MNGNSAHDWKFRIRAKRILGINVSYCSLLIHPVSGSFIFLFSMHNIFLSRSRQSPSFTIGADDDILRNQKRKEWIAWNKREKKHLSLIADDWAGFKKVKT